MFLIGLLLVGGRLRNIIKIVSSFTIAHSMTLALAALDVINPPSRFIELMVALSIAYIGAENIFTKIPDKRWLVSFIFGLVHGFGFASVLKDSSGWALSGRALIVPLFSFNLGVELGQVAVVSGLFPALYYLYRSKRRREIQVALSAIILAFGTNWFVRRAFF